VDKFRKTKLNYKREEYKNINKFFENINWDDALGDKSIHDCYTEFLKIYNEACERCMPKIKADVNHRFRPGVFSET
jgi:hypothetical protein